MDMDVGCNLCAHEIKRTDVKHHFFPFSDRQLANLDSSLEPVTRYQLPTLYNVAEKQPIISKYTSFFILKDGIT